MPTAIEEFLRAYAPVTMAREVVKETEINGCTFKPGQMVLLSFPAANRDPAMFPDADKVHHRPQGEPARRLRPRHPPLRRLEPGAHGDDGGGGGAAEAHPRVQARRRGNLVGGHRARAAQAADRVLTVATTTQRGKNMAASVRRSRTGPRISTTSIRAGSTIRSRSGTSCGRSARSPTPTASRASICRRATRTCAPSPTIPSTSPRAR